MENEHQQGLQTRPFLSLALAPTRGALSQQTHLAAAVYRNAVARDEPRLVRNQERDQLPNLLRRAHTAEGSAERVRDVDAPLQEGIVLLRTEAALLLQVCHDDPRVHAVDSDAVRREVDSRTPAAQGDLFKRVGGVSS